LKKKAYKQLGEYNMVPLDSERIWVCFRGHTRMIREWTRHLRNHTHESENLYSALAVVQQAKVHKHVHNS
jgi:hypothetical protein